MPHKMMKLFLFRKVKFVLQVVGGWWLCEAGLTKTWEMAPVFKSLCAGSPTRKHSVTLVLNQECLVEKLE